ncbi:MAG: MXAN_6577-like cysteine-rich protein, partial [Deltaproteobacteria bacterium]
CTGSICSATCAAGQTQCDGACVTTDSDPSHCGACPNACAAGEVCVRGSCTVSCPAGETVCNNRCADTNTSTTHCGTCGHACPAGQVCQAGVCGDSCVAGQTLCSGRCATLAIDVNHCGACATRCTSGQICVAGACTTVCVAPQVMCGTTCTNTGYDPANCGACGTACPGGESCLAGVCQPLAAVDGGCAPPSVACGPTCTDIRSDNAHCGGCTTACTPDRTCVSGMCLPPCAAGSTTRCGASMTCTNLLTDRSNCGACGTTCPAGQVCGAGACAVGSYSGYVESTPLMGFVDACSIPGHTVVLTSLDDSTAIMTLPFEFIFYGYRGSAAWVSSNGVSGFCSAATTTYSNVCLPAASGPQNALLAFWDDLHTRPAGVCIGTLGTGPSRVQVITWSDAYTLGDATSSLTFSAMLTETTHTVDLVYQTLTGASATGTSATVGVQDQARTVSTQYSCDTASLMSGAAIRFTPM